jgi:hypothetical protein
MRHSSPSFALTTALLALATGCGPQFAVVPRGGAPTVSASSPTGITMTALAEQWDGDPSDLTDYVTPIAVELYNGSSEEVRVSLADFALKDERGTRYPAVSPFIPASEYGEFDLKALTPYMLAQRVAPLMRMGGPPPVHVGGSRSSFGGAPAVGVGGGSLGGRPSVHVGGGFRPHGYAGFGPRPYYGGGRVVVGTPPGFRYPHTRWGGGYWRPGGWHGFMFAPGLRAYYGPSMPYWSFGWGYTPYYSNWVMWWGPSYYPAPPSYDVVAFALPEGVLPPAAA